MCFSNFIKNLLNKFKKKSDREYYSDENDVSWRIRSAAAKCLEAIINTRHDLLNVFYCEISPLLIECFRGLRKLEKDKNFK